MIKTHWKKNLIVDFIFKNILEKSLKKIFRLRVIAERILFLIKRDLSSPIF